VAPLSPSGERVLGSEPRAGSTEALNLRIAPISTAERRSDPAPASDPAARPADEPEHRPVDAAVVRRGNGDVRVLVAVVEAAAEDHLGRGIDVPDCRMHLAAITATGGDRRRDTELPARPGRSIVSLCASRESEGRTAAASETTAASGEPDQHSSSRSDPSSLRTQGPRPATSAATAAAAQRRGLSRARVITTSVRWLPTRSPARSHPASSLARPRRSRRMYGRRWRPRRRAGADDEERPASVGPVGRDRARRRVQVR
jgi:hypothetical protein